MKKKISIEKYLELEKRDREEINRLDKLLSEARVKAAELLELIRIIRYKKIDLNELEKLGLQRYNAKYGKVVYSEVPFGYRFLGETTYVGDWLYEELIKHQIILYQERKEK